MLVGVICCYVVLCGFMLCYVVLCGAVVVVVAAVLRGCVACRGAWGDGGECAGACVVVVLHLMLRGIS